MLKLKNILRLSRKIATALLKHDDPTHLNDTSLIEQNDKAYVRNELTDEQSIRERSEFIESIDKKKAWKAIEREVDLGYKLSYWRYAAAASIALMVGLSFYFLDSSNANYNTPQEIQTISKTSIEIGTDKATLTLANGSKVNLTKETKFQNSHVTSDGTKLKYAKKSKTAEQIVYNYLTVPRGGQFELELADGSHVWLNSDSSLKYPEAFEKGKAREVELLYGEAYFDVSSSSEHNGASFQVLHKTQTIQVLGTEFNIRAYSDNTDIYTTLIEGSVGIEAGEVSKILKPGFQAQYRADTKNIALVKVDTYNETSWRHGVFSFEGKPLHEIMNVLGRWYDVTFVFENEGLKDERFIGVLGKDQKIDDILLALTHMGSINAYRIEKKTVFLK